MKNYNIEKSAYKYAKITGLLYLVIFTCGIVSEMYVRGTLIVPGDALATTKNIINFPFLFRIGFVSDLIMATCDVVVAWAFYILLKPVNKNLALLAAFFRLSQAIIIGINLLNYYTPLLILDGVNYTVTSIPNQVSDSIMLFLNAHTYGYLISGVFFGISCLLLGYLLYKSAYFPKFLGVLLVIAACGYLIDAFTNFLFPAYGSSTEILVVLTAVVAELSLCLWLLIKGIKKQTMKTTVALQNNAY